MLVTEVGESPIETVRFGNNFEWQHFDDWFEMLVSLKSHQQNDFAINILRLWPSQIHQNNVVINMAIIRKLILTLSTIILTRLLHRCWPRILETKCVGENYEMLMTVWSFSSLTSTNIFIHERQKPKFKRCNQHRKIVTLNTGLHGCWWLCLGDKCWMLVKESILVTFLNASSQRLCWKIEGVGDENGKFRLQHPSPTRHQHVYFNLNPKLNSK